MSVPGYTIRAMAGDLERCPRPSPRPRLARVRRLCRYDHWRDSLDRNAGQSQPTRQRAQVNIENKTCRGQLLQSPHGIDGH
jgi:hypothetical protein